MSDQDFFDDVDAVEAASDANALKANDSVLEQGSAHIEAAFENTTKAAPSFAVVILIAVFALLLGIVIGFVLGSNEVVSASSLDTSSSTESVSSTATTTITESDLESGVCPVTSTTDDSSTSTTSTENSEV